MKCNDKTASDQITTVCDAAMMQQKHFSRRNTCYKIVTRGGAALSDRHCRTSKIYICQITSPDITIVKVNCTANLNDGGSHGPADS